MIIDVSIATGTQKLWKQERIILYINGGDDVLLYTNLEGSAAAPIATYTPPSDGELYIDVTDYVRAHPTVSHIYVVDTDNSTTYDVEVSVAGLINPDNMIIPYHAEESNFRIIPPSRMIAPLTGQSIMVGFNAHERGDDATFSFRNLGLQMSTNAVDGAVIPSYYTGGFFLSIHDTGWTQLIKYLYTPQVCGVEYAMVRWESSTGATRCHTMEVTKCKSETKNAFSLLPIDNEYIEIKGREDGFTLRINGLSKYDIWYYADMIHSSKVEVKVNGKDWARVQVTKKSITIPDGEATDGVLEVQVNWKRYDAVAM